MSQYSIFKEDEKAFHMLHPDGSTFQVAKQAIGPEMVEHIKQTIPLHMAEGGEVPDSDPEAYKQRLAELFKNVDDSKVRGLKLLIDDSAPSQTLPVENVPGKESQVTVPPVIQEPQAPPQSAVTPGPVVQAISDSGVGLQKDLGNIPAPQVPDQSKLLNSYGLIPTTQGQLAGIHKKAVAESDQAKANAESLAAFNTAMEIQGAQAQATYNNFLTKHDQLVNDFKNEKIDPNREWNNRSTGNKILAGIGILLSGFGAGAGGGENLALKQIYKAIDNDIDAQKSEILKRKDLIADNEHGLKNFIEWESGERSRKLAAVNALIQQHAAMSGSPIALATEQIAQNELKQKIGQIGQQSTMQLAALSGADPVTARINLLLPKEQHSEALKEYGEFTSKQKALNNLDDIFSKAAKVQTVANRLGNPIHSAHDIDALNGQLAEAVISASPSKRLSEEVGKQLIEPFKVKVSDSDKSIAFKLQAVKNIIKANAPPTPILSGRGWLPSDTGPVKFTPAR